MQASRSNLIERAGKPCDELLGRFPEIREVDLTLYKPRAPIAADFETVAVQLKRKQTGV